MGGLVNTSIRFDDGELVNTLIYTSGINRLFLSKALYDRDKKALKSLLKKLRMTTWENKIFDAAAPHDYGLIVADFTSDITIDMQGYCSVGRYNIASLFLDNIENIEKFVESEEYKKSELKQIVDIFLDQRSIGINYYDGKRQYLSIDETRGSLKLDNFRDIYTYLAEIDKKYKMAQLNYDTRCIVKKLGEHDYETYLNLLSSIDYPLNERDKSIFEDLIRKYSGYERTYSDPM